MISSRKDLAEYLARDAVASGRSSVRPRFFGDEIWKYQIALRKSEYYNNLHGIKRVISFPFRFIYRLRYHSLAVKLNITIPLNAFEKGLSIAHFGSIVVANHAKIGENCRIHECVTIGATNGSCRAAIIGDNVFIASGAKIIGDITISDDVAIGANAVVVSSIEEKGTSWGGVPARKISDNNYHVNLNKRLFL